MNIHNKYLVIEKKKKGDKITPSQVEDAIEQAKMAFWSTIFDFIPQIEDSNVDSLIQKKLNNMMKVAVDNWIKQNGVNIK